MAPPAGARDTSPDTTLALARTFQVRAAGDRVVMLGHGASPTAPQFPVNHLAVTEKVNLAEKLASLDEAFSPKIVGFYNDSKIQVVKVRGEFVWHSHPDTDDFFLVLEGTLTIDLPERSVELGPGELFVVPKGVRHRSRSDGEAQILLIEPQGTPNTGDPETAAPEQKI